MRGAPIPPEQYESEDVGEVMTDEFLERNSWAFGLRVWEQLGKAYEWYLGHNADRPDGLDNAQFWSLQEAIKADARHGEKQEIPEEPKIEVPSSPAGLFGPDGKPLTS